MEIISDISAPVTKFRFPGGFFSPPGTIFEMLEEYNLKIPKEDKIFPWFAVFDFEAMLEKIEEKPSDKLFWSQRHCPVSVSICSNVPGFQEPICIIDSDLDKLLAKMFDHLNAIQTMTHNLAKEKWGHIADELNDLVKKWVPDKAVSKNKGHKNKNQKEHNDNFFDKEASDDDDDYQYDDRESVNGQKGHAKMC